MKKALYLLLTAGLFFAGAIYRYAFLTALAAALLLLFFALFALSRFRARVTVGFDRTEVEAERGETAELRALPRGLPRRLPDGPFRVTVTGQGKPLRLRAVSAAEGLGLKLTAEHCGLRTLTLERASLSDPAGLFAAPCKDLRPNTAAFLVWPRRSVEAEAASLPLLPEDQAEALLARSLGSQEPDGVREYRPGDPIRRLHFKLSAKTDELYLREFREETKPVRLLDPAHWAALREADPDDWYDTLHSHALAVLEAGEWLALPEDDGLRLVTTVSAWYDWLREAYEQGKRG